MAVSSLVSLKTRWGDISILRRGNDVWVELETDGKIQRISLERLQGMPSRELTRGQWEAFAARSSPIVSFDERGNARVDLNPTFPHRDGIMRIPRCDLTYLEPLSQGDFSEVFTGKWREQPVVIKRLIGWPSKGALEELENAQKSISDLGHSHIVKLYGICERPWSLVVEHMPHALHHLLRNRPHLSWESRYRIGLEVAHALHALHEQGIVHGNLKSSNVLLDGNLCAKISDTALSRAWEQGNATIPRGMGEGYLRWMAPELFNGHPCDKRSDIFSYGLLLWEIASRNTPLSGMDPETLKWRMGSGMQGGYAADWSLNCILLIVDCLHREPAQRPSTAEVRTRLSQILLEEQRGSASPRSSGGYSMGRCGEESASTRRELPFDLEYITPDYGRAIVALKGEWLTCANPFLLREIRRRLREMSQRNTPQGLSSCFWDVPLPQNMRMHMRQIDHIVGSSNVQADMHPIVSPLLQIAEQRIYDMAEQPMTMWRELELFLRFSHVQMLENQKIWQILRLIRKRQPDRLWEFFKNSLNLEQLKKMENYIREKECVDLRTFVEQLAWERFRNRSGFSRYLNRPFEFFVGKRLCVCDFDTSLFFDSAVVACEKSRFSIRFVCDLEYGERLDKLFLFTLPLQSNASIRISQRQNECALLPALCNGAIVPGDLGELHCKSVPMGDFINPEFDCTSPVSSDSLFELIPKGMYRIVSFGDVQPDRLGVFTLVLEGVGSSVRLKFTDHRKVRRVEVLKEHEIQGRKRVFRESVPSWLSDTLFFTKHIEVDRHGVDPENLDRVIWITRRKRQVTPHC